jgi:hypothetical protein
MTKLGGWAGGLVLAGCLICSAAAPFETLAPDSPTAAHIQQYIAAGLIEAPAPAAPLTRLQAALLVKRALAAYGQFQLDGRAADPAVEADLRADLLDLGPELEVVGVDPAPGLAAVEAAPAVKASCEAPPGESCGAAAAPAADAGPCECTCDECSAEEVPPIELTPYGDVALQLRGSRTELAAGGNLDASDINFYWGEVGIDAQSDELRGHLSVLINDRAGSIDLHEAYAVWQSEGSDLAVKAGRTVLPPGSRLTTFPTYPAAVDLVYTRANAVGVTVGDAKSSLTALAFNPAVEIAGENDTFSDYAFGLHLADSDDPADDGFEFNATYTSHVGAADIQLAGPGPLASRVGGANTWAQWRWGGGEHSLLAEYSWSFKAFATADLDANADGVGDRPKAFDAEYIHTSEDGCEFGVSLQKTRQMADYAKERWAILAGKQLTPHSTLRFEASRGTFDAFSTTGAKKDFQLVTELRVKY